MVFIKSKINSKQALKLATVSIGTFLLVNPPVNAVDSAKSNFGAYNRLENTSEIANYGQSASEFLPHLPSLLLAQSEPRGCPENQNILQQWETKNFFVTICDDFTSEKTAEHTCVGVAKNGIGSITLDVRKHINEQGADYVAIKDNYRFVLHAKTPSNLGQLKITRKGKTIVNEKAELIYSKQ